MNSNQRFVQHQVTSFLRRLVVWICTWTLFTTIAHAADVGHESYGLHLRHLAGLYLYPIMMAIWVFVLGACIGSFLNVVIYRLPAGMALSRPGSRCPVCETELTAKDNVPILGWLALRGRCRYCSTTISSRYPTIETLVGLLFLAVLLVEARTGGSNLPFHPSIHFVDQPLDVMLRYGQWSPLGSFALHSFYLTVVLAVCMIGYDGHAPPKKLVRIGVIVALLAGIVWPALRPVHTIVPLPDSLNLFVGGTLRLPSALGGGRLLLGFWLVGLLEGICGLISGVVTGWLAARAVSSESAISATVRSVLLLAGVYCGWQFTWALLTAVLLLIGLTRLLRSGFLQRVFPLILFGVCCGLLLGWSRLLNGVVFIRHDGWQWTGTAARIDWAATIVVLSSLAFALSLWKPAVRQTAADPDEASMPGDATV